MCLVHKLLCSLQCRRLNVVNPKKAQHTLSAKWIMQAVVLGTSNLQLMLRYRLLKICRAQARGMWFVLLQWSLLHKFHATCGSRAWNWSIKVLRGLVHHIETSLDKPLWNLYHLFVMNDTLSRRHTRVSHPSSHNPYVLRHVGVAAYLRRLNCCFPTMEPNPGSRRNATHEAHVYNKSITSIPCVWLFLVTNNRHVTWKQEFFGFFLTIMSPCRHSS